MDKARLDLFEAFIKKSMTGYGVEAAQVNADENAIEVSGLGSSWDAAQKWANVTKMAMPDAIANVSFGDDKITMSIASAEQFAARIKIGMVSQMPDQAFINQLNVA